MDYLFLWRCFGLGLHPAPAATTTAALAGRPRRSGRFRQLAGKFADVPKDLLFLAKLILPLPCVVASALGGQAASDGLARGNAGLMTNRKQRDQRELPHLILSFDTSKFAAAVGAIECLAGSPRWGSVVQLVVLVDRHKVFQQQVIVLRYFSVTI